MYDAMDTLKQEVLENAVLGLERRVVERLSSY